MTVEYIEENQQGIWRVIGILASIVILIVGLIGLLTVGGGSTGTAEGDEGSVGLIDDQGNWVVEPGERNLDSFPASGLFLVQESGRVGLINPQGETVVSPEYQDIDPGGEGRLLATDSEGTVLLSRDGEELSESYDEITTWEFDLYRVEKNEQVGLLDRSGQLVLPIEYDDLEPLDGVIKLVRSDGEGLALTGGEVVLQPTYDAVQSGPADLYLVAQEGLLGIADESGLLVEPRFNETRNLDGKLTAVREGKLWGLLRDDGTLVVEPQFQQIQDVENNRVLVTTDQDE